MKQDHFDPGARWNVNRYMEWSPQEISVQEGWIWGRLTFERMDGGDPNTLEQ